MTRLSIALALLSCVPVASLIVAPLALKLVGQPAASRAVMPAKAFGDLAMRPAVGCAVARRAASPAMQEGEGSSVSDTAGIAYAGAIFASIFAAAGLMATGSPPNGLAFATVCLVGFTVAAKVLVPDKD